METKSLFYSATAAEAFGTLTYRTVEGVEVEVTLVGDPGAWPDTVKVGETAADYSGWVRTSDKRRATNTGFMR